MQIEVINSSFSEFVFVQKKCCFFLIYFYCYYIFRDSHAGACAEFYHMHCEYYCSFDIPQEFES